MRVQSGVEAAASVCCTGAAAENWFGVTRYFNDVWEYDTEEHKWTCRSTAAVSAPAARGGCQVAIHGTVLFVIGGHTAWKEGKQEQEKVHDDVWALDLQTWQVKFHWFLSTSPLPFPTLPPTAPSPHSPPHTIPHPQKHVSFLLTQTFQIVLPQAVCPSGWLPLGQQWTTVRRQGTHCNFFFQAWTRMPRKEQLLVLNMTGHA